MTGHFDQAAMLAAFARHYGKTARLFRAPARINIIGEHTDYNDGLVMPANADLYTWLAIAPRDDRVVRMHSLNFDEQVEADLDDLLPSPGGAWPEYPRGVFDALQREGFELLGADLLIAGKAPMRSGLSSSAAIEAVVGFAMLTIAGHEIDRSHLARICQHAENDYVGMSCGIMDQFSITACQRGHAIMLDCRSLEYELAPLPANMKFLIVHSGVHRQLSDGRYNERRKECETAAALLARQLSGVTALRDVTVDDLETSRSLLGDVLFRRALHVVTDIDRVRTACRALRDSDPRTLGEAMSASHSSLRDAFEISCDELDALVDIAMSCDGVFGSRMMGGGFGGCTVTAAHPEHIDRVQTEIRVRYKASFGHDPWCYVLGEADPVGEVPNT